MAKLLFAILVIVLVGFGIYLFSSRQSQPSPTPLSRVDISPTSGPDDDLTALDRDLNELDNSEASFSSELNSL